MPLSIRDFLTSLAIAALLALPGTPGLAGTTEAFTLPAQDYAGSRERQYKVYRPEGLAAPAAMVMALHGCRQNHDDVLRDWGLTAAADRYGFLLVTPFITSYDGFRNPNCWGFWFDGHRHEGRGEPEDLHRIALAVEANHQVDPARRYILGLSSGAAMTAVAATTHNEYWAAAASAAGLPYGEDATAVSLSGRCPGSALFHEVPRVVDDMGRERDDAYPIPLMVLQNERDCTVLQPAGRNLRDAQLQAFAPPQRDRPETALASLGPCTPSFGEDYGCRHAVYTADGAAGSRSIVETVFYDGPQATPSTTDEDHGHYWIGGEQGRDGNFALRRGPSYPDIVWDFFLRHPRTGPAGDRPPKLDISGRNPLQLPLGQAFADPGAEAEDAEDGPLVVEADCGGLNTQRVGRYACRYLATDSAGNTTAASRSVEVIDPAVPEPSCRTAHVSPAMHIYAGRAVAAGWFLSRALSAADRQDIGYSWAFWPGVTLHEGEPGKWYAWPPQGCALP